MGGTDLRVGRTHSGLIACTVSPLTIIEYGQTNITSSHEASPKPQCMCGGLAGHHSPIKATISSRHPPSHSDGAAGRLTDLGAVISRPGAE